jgi:hypothetical protein
MFKKIFPIIVALSFLVGAAGATAGVAFAAGGTNYPATITTSSTNHFGNEGFSSANTAFSQDVTVSKFAPSQVRGLNGVKFIKPIISLEQNTGMASSEKVPAPATVYFDVTPRISDIAENIMDKEVAANNENAKVTSSEADMGLTIYYLAPGATGWTPLSTRMTQSTNGTVATASVPGYGWYALGIEK